ncbi:MAG: histidinol dehydrogenase [Armatimonadetes bacterium]|nr:histidinol dehydrogenase [Armatimonadota bacterium]
MPGQVRSAIIHWTLKGCSNMKIFETERDPISEVIGALTAQPAGTDPNLESAVRKIIEDVRRRGDEALIELGRKFDSPELVDLRVSEREFDDALSSVKPELVEAIQIAKSNIEAFHRRQVTNSWIELGIDFVYGQVVRPIEIVGIYAPAGLAPYPSTVLMTAVPAAVAGVERLVMCCPAQKDGRAHPAMLVAARECGVNEIFKVGGAQAVAAMAYGTETVPRVDKIVGPGGTFVNEAKRQVFGAVGIDQLAGPSEILVLADDSADPAYVAADILSQAEHADDSRCALITNSRALADATLREIKSQTDTASRAHYIGNSLERNGIVVIARDLDECAELANVFAPEHLELIVSEPWDVLKKIKNAGTIMLGPMTPVPLCDFAAGPNHTLPTGGTARFSSPLGVDDFLKKSGLLSFSPDGLRRLAPTVLELAAAEGFEAHANTIRVRLRESGSAENS